MDVTTKSKLHSRECNSDAKNKISLVLLEKEQSLTFWIARVVPYAGETQTLQEPRNERPSTVKPAYALQVDYKLVLKPRVDESDGQNSLNRAFN